MIFKVGCWYHTNKNVNIRHYSSHLISAQSAVFYIDNFLWYEFYYEFYLLRYTSQTNNYNVGII